jgi:ubiquinone/menaquinone biosynthesis C-methylase UbiE
MLHDTERLPPPAPKRFWPFKTRTYERQSKADLTGNDCSRLANGTSRATNGLLADWDCEGMKVLDVGCATGRDIAGLNAAWRYGIDFNASLIEEARRTHPDVTFKRAVAEEIPFGDGEFDAVMSLVSLPYTDMRKSVRELHRVMKPGAKLLLTMHDWRLHWQFFCFALKGKSYKRCIDLVFVTFAGLYLALTGRTLRKPWTGHIETWQTKGLARSMLEDAGFENVSMRYYQKPGSAFRDWVIEARRV